MAMYMHYYTKSETTTTSASRVQFLSKYIGNKKVCTREMCLYQTTLECVCPRISASRHKLIMLTDTCTQTKFKRLPGLSLCDKHNYQLNRIMKPLLLLLNKNK